MANQSTVRGSVTLRKLRSGATATFSLSSTMQLFQLYTVRPDSTINCTPDWSGANTHPEVTVNAVSSMGNIEITNVVWKINGQPATGSAFPNISASSTGGVHKLIINQNLASALNRNSGTLTAEITYKDDSGHVSTIEKSEIIRIQQAVADGYYVMIDTPDGTVVKAAVGSQAAVTARLVAKCYCNGAEATGITFKWFGSTDPTATALGGNVSQTTLTVDDTMVNGSQLFICRAYDGNNVEVDAEGVNVVDNSDQLIISASVVSYNSSGQPLPNPQNNVTSVNVASDSPRSTVTYQVTDQDGTPHPATPTSFEAWKYHADTMKLIESVAGASHTKDTATPNSYNHIVVNGAQTVSVDVVDADYVSVGNGSDPKHDTEVIVTAQANF